MNKLIIFTFVFLVCLSCCECTRKHKPHSKNVKRTTSTTEGPSDILEIMATHFQGVLEGVGGRLRKIWRALRPGLKKITEVARKRQDIILNQIYNGHKDKIPKFLPVLLSLDDQELTELAAILRTVFFTPYVGGEIDPAAEEFEDIWDDLEVNPRPFFK